MVFITKIYGLHYKNIWSLLQKFSQISILRSVSLFSLKDWNIIFLSQWMMWKWLKMFSWYHQFYLLLQAIKNTRKIKNWIQKSKFRQHFCFVIFQFIFSNVSFISFYDFFIGRYLYQQPSWNHVLQSCSDI